MRAFYMAEDGKIFDNHTECIEYEKKNNLKTRVEYYTESVLKINFTIKLYAAFLEDIEYEDISNEEKVQNLVKNFAKNEFFIESDLNDEDYDILSTNVEITDFDFSHDIDY